MFYRLLTAAFIGTGLSLAVPAVAEDTPNAKTVLATVGDVEITLGHVLALRASLPAQYDQFPAEMLFTGVFDQLVQQTVLMQAQDGELSLAAGLRMENERRAIIAADVASKVIDEKVTEEALQKAYEVQYANAQPEKEYKASHILVKTEEEAQELIKALDGGANFAALAQEKSTDASGPSGGDLGWFGEGVMIPEFFAAVTALEVGTHSAPVETQFGWHVIQLNETRMKERPTFEEARDAVAESLRQEAFATFLADRMAATVIKREEADKLDPELINRVDLLEN